jgi:membrane protease YdiL (CAAX protease family)
MSLVITSFIFGAIHLDLIGLPIRFILGIFLGDLAQRRNYNIVGPSVAHGFNNAIVVVLASFGF